MACVPKSLDRFAGIAAGVGFIAALPAGAPLAAQAAGILQIASAGLAGLLERLSPGQPDARAVLQDFSENLRRDWHAWAEIESPSDAGDDEAAIAAFDDYVTSAGEALLPTPAEIMKLNRDPDRIAAALVTRAATHAEADYGRPDAVTLTADQQRARAFLRNLSRAAFTHLLADERFQRALAPAFETEVLVRLGGIDDLLRELLNREGSQDSHANLEAEKARLERELAELRDKLDQNDGAVLNTLRIVLRRPDITAEALPTALSAIERETAKLRQKLATIANETPASIRSLGGLADRALADRDLDLARRLFDRIHAIRKQEAASTTAQEEAKDIANMAQVELVALDYRKAADLFADASDSVRSHDEEAAWQHAMQSADALQSLGREFGDNEAILDAIAYYEAVVLPLAPRTRPLDWAATQNDLGNALASLGERKNGTHDLERAVDAYNNALLEFTRHRAPLDWAMTQNNLGNALANLGRRENGTQNLERAVDAYSNALREWTCERVPLLRAAAQNNLGNALRALGERQCQAHNVKRAVDAYNNALLGWTRDRVPLRWATAQNNLGNALRTLGERENDTRSLERAADAYNSALEERTRKRVPLDWAMTQNSLGSALANLGERDKNPQKLKSAVKAYSNALSEWTRQRVPFDWAATKNNLGNAFRVLGELEADTHSLERAVDAYNDALLEFTRERVPLEWAYAQHGLAHALEALGGRRVEPALIEEAIAHMEGAAEVYREGNIGHWLPIAEQSLARMRAKLDAVRAGGGAG